jgi:hypothetical protein
VPGSFGHLANRLLDYITAHPLGERDTELAESWLSAAERGLFFAQSPKDQAHGFRSGLMVAREHPERGDLIKAAALHDVGKRHARLGAMGRSVASLAIKFRLPMSSRMRIYRDHGALGSAELAGAGSPPIAVEFARDHHGRRPDSIQPEEWALLVAADEPPKPRVRRSPR